MGMPFPGNHSRSVPQGQWCPRYAIGVRHDGLAGDSAAVAQRVMYPL